MGIDISQIATNLIKDEETSLWLSTNTAQISYPEDGNEICSRIEETSYWFKHRNNCIIEVVRAFPPSGPIFDIGGGNGFVSSALQAIGQDVVLVEPGISGAKNAKGRGVATVICSTLENAGFKKHSLPAIGLFDVMEHIEEDASFLHTVNSLLISGGKLYITVPAHDFLWSVEDDFAKHFRRYTLSSMASKLLATGFSLDFSTYIFSSLVVPLFLFRTVPSKLKLRRNILIDRYRNEHSLPTGIMGRIINWSFQMEAGLLSRKRSIHFGASCLIVASAQ